MTQTANYQLSQYTPEDRIMREHFNSDFAKIDAALAAQAASITALTAAAGNCAMELKTYVGTGVYGSDTPTSISFAQKPDIFIIAGDVALIVGKWGEATPLIASRSGASGGFVGLVDTAYSGNTIKLRNTVNARFQANSEGEDYWALGLRVKR